MSLWHLTENREDGWESVKPTLSSAALEAPSIFEDKPLHEPFM